MNARPEEGLAGVDIAHANDRAVVHNEVLDRAFAPLALGLQIAGVEGAGERLGAEVLQVAARVLLALVEHQH